MTWRHLTTRSWEKTEHCVPRSSPISLLSLEEMSPSLLLMTGLEPTTSTTIENSRTGSPPQILGKDSLLLGYLHGASCPGSPWEVWTHLVTRCTVTPRCCSPTTTPSASSLWEVDASATATPMSASPVTPRTQPAATFVCVSMAPLETTARPVCPTTGTGDGREQPLRAPTPASVSRVVITIKYVKMDYEEHCSLWV